MKNIIYNAIRTPDGTVLESRFRHDFRYHVDKNGLYYAVDGGHDYIRRAHDVQDYEELSLYSDDPIEKIREHFTWGTSGLSGKEPTKYVKLKDLELPHIHNIIGHILNVFPEGNYISQLMREELKFRLGA